MLFIRMHVRIGHVQAKKLAKVLLFFHMAKFFLKKMQKIFIFLQIVMFTWQKWRNSHTRTCIFRKIVVPLRQIPIVWLNE